MNEATNQQMRMTCIVACTFAFLFVASWDFPVKLIKKSRPPACIDAFMMDV